jgi:hypothetical protein
MPKTFYLPRDLQKSFFRLMSLVPVPFRYEEQLQKDILSFLKLEGEEFVRNKIEKSIRIFSGRAEDKSVEAEKEK